MRLIPLRLFAVILFGSAALAGCGGSAAHSSHEASSRAELVRRIDAALAAGGAFLVERQSDDGAWRSRTYGFMKDGPSLTPHVAACLRRLGGGAGSEAAGKGAAYLKRLVVDGSVPDDLPLIFPAYTAADAVRIFSDHSSPHHDAGASRAWLAYLARHRLGGNLGWEREDLEFGGWGYAMRPGRRAGEVRGPWDWSNLSATRYAVEAMRAAGAADDRVFRDVLVFVRRCQNFAGEGEAGGSDDGGFFFTPAEAIRNKAGAAGADGAGRTRFRSYGSMTADGILALLACGVPADHPRVTAARDWLRRNFSAEHNPGDFVPENEDLRDATYYYYCYAAASALGELKEDGEEIDRAAAMAGALLKRQREDGAWVNSFTDAREDDPLVATPLAMGALMECRARLVESRSED